MPPLFGEKIGARRGYELEFAPERQSKLARTCFESDFISISGE